MLLMDMKTIFRLSRFNRNYDDPIGLNYENCRFEKIQEASSKPSYLDFGVPRDEVIGILRRLNEMEYITLYDTYSPFFFLTYKTRHWFQILLDAFTKRFFCGFILGIVVGITANVAAHFIINEIELILQTVH